MLPALYEVARRIFDTHDKTAAIQHYRTTLEPYIYMHMAQTYGAMLEKHWATYLPPTKSDYACVIIERRCHPHFRFILQSVAWAAPYMSVYLFCSNENKAFLQALLGDKVGHYTLVETFAGADVPRAQAIQDYNHLLTDVVFYQAIQAQYMMTVQMDNIFRRQLPVSVFVGDYWGNPWFWEKDAAGGGGASIRRVAYMVALCRKHRPDPSVPLDCNEDSWCSIRTTEFPPLAFRTEFSMESVPADDPYLLHQFWTFANPYIELGRDFFLQYWGFLLTMR